MTIEASKNIAETLLAEMPRLGEVQTISVPTADTPEAPFIVAVPDGLRVEDFTSKHRAVLEALKPLQRTGKAVLADLDSLIAWTNRFKGEDSALFGQIHPEPKLISVIDYHGAGAPVVAPEAGDPTANYGRHRAVYNFPVSEEWKRWHAIDGKALDKDVFGEFIEAQASDFLDPTPALLGKPGDQVEDWEQRMIDIAAKIQGRFGQYAAINLLSRELKIHEVGHIEVKTNRDTGEAQVQFLTEHRSPDGSPLTLPNLFMIAIPVFEEGALYRLAVRFRYRKSGQDVKFIASIYNPDAALRDAAREAMDHARDATELPLMMGLPEIGAS